MIMTPLLITLLTIFGSGITGAFLGLLGVLLSNYGNNSRLKLQLAHDSSEKSKDRTKSLRLDVCLKAVEDMTKAQYYLASLPQSVASSSNIAEKLQEFMASMAKLQLVTEPKTALKISELTSAYGELTINLILRLKPLQDAKTDIDIGTKLYEKSQLEIARLQREISNHTESARSDHNVFSALNESYRFNMRNADTYTNKIESAWKEFNKSLLLFNSYLFGEMMNISDLQMPVLIAIREDLGLTSNLKEFSEQMKNQQQKISLALTKAMEEISGTVS